MKENIILGFIMGIALILLKLIYLLFKNLL